MLISICDDNLIHSSMLEEIIIEYCKKFMNLSIDIDVFQSAESLLKQINTLDTSYQILFLDIEMEGMNGIEAAHQIRKIDSDILIIYVTSYDNYTLESFEVKPFRYLLKPIQEEKLTHVLSQAFDEVLKSNQYLFYKQQNMQYQISCDKIMTITSENGRMLRVCTTSNDEDILFYGKIKEIEKQLNPFRFVKANPGTIIHLNHVSIITGNEVYLTDNQIISISRGQKKVVKDTYNDFISKRVGINL